MKYGWLIIGLLGAGAVIYGLVTTGECNFIMVALTLINFAFYEIYSLEDKVKDLER